MFLLKLRSGELVGCGIWLCIQREPALYTFGWPHYPKNKKYLKKCDDDVIITFFQVFLVFGVAGSIKSMQCGYSLMRNQIPHPTSSPDWNLSKNTMRYVENTNKKSSFIYLFMIPTPKFILKNCLRPIRYPKKIKAISLTNTWWHGIWIRVKGPILSWNFL